MRNLLILRPRRGPQSQACHNRSKLQGMKCRICHKSFARRSGECNVSSTFVAVPPALRRAPIGRCGFGSGGCIFNEKGACAPARPPLYTRHPNRRRGGPWKGARSSAGEHYVDIVGVTGSIPVAPTIKTPEITRTSPSPAKPSSLGRRATDTQLGVGAT